MPLVLKTVVIHRTLFHGTLELHKLLANGVLFFLFFSQTISVEQNLLTLLSHITSLNHETLFLQPKSNINLLMEKDIIGVI